MRPTKSSIHVLMTTDSVGGVWTYCLDLAAATRDLGVRFTLACLGPRPSAEQRRRASALGNVRLECMECRLEWMDRAWDDVRAGGVWLRELEQRDQPDVVHLNGYSHAACGFAAPVVVVAHSCVLSWWRAVKGCDAPPEWDEYRARVHAGLAAADALVAPTGAMLAEVRRLYPTSTPARVLHNGRAHSRPLAAPREPIVAAVGRMWDEAKNIRAVTRAAPELPWRCVVAGEPCSPDGRTVRPANVEVLGAVSQEEVWSLLERASILAHPARYEPFGLAPLEAALAGCALVLGDIPSLREVWGDAALFVDPIDSGALSASLRRLIADGRLRGEMAVRGRARALRYGLPRFGREYASLYRDLTARVADGRELSAAT